MDARNALARGIAKLRKERGWTQAHLAEVADVSLQFVAAMEQAAKAPSLETVDRLAAVFGVRPSELFAAGEETSSRPGPGKDLLRAAGAVPAAHEADAVELLRVLSRSVSRASAAASKARTRAVKGTRRASR